MTRLWNSKTHECLLVLTVLMLARNGWTFDERDSRKLNGFTGGSYLEIVIGTTADANSLQYHLSRWNYSGGSAKDNVTYYGEGIPDVFFHSSAENGSLTFTDLSRCLQDFKFIVCLKLMLVNRLDNLIDYMNDNNLTNTDFSFGNGIVSFKCVPGVNDYEERAIGNGEGIGLDEDITRKVMELFKDRSLHLNLLPGVGLDIKPVPAKSGFIGFKARPYLNFWRNDDQPEERGRKKGGFKMPSMMIMPQLIMFGLMPFALANLQAMVMNAFMLNMMALNSAIFMTIRNLVFGPRGGPKVKYVNYGYRKKKKSNVPTIIVHSPAAFVKQPFRPRKKPIRHHPPPHPPHHFHRHHGGIDDYQTIDFPPVRNGIEVFEEDGQLDGKNRVRIRINEENGPSVNEVLHRIRTIENHEERFPFDYSQTGSGDNTPWTVSDHSASHASSDTQSLQSEDYVINYDQNQFTPMRTHPKNKR